MTAMFFNNLLYRLRAESLLWSVTMALMFADDAAMLAMMLC